ncbi:hypothetical protein Ccrd_021244 [Cynara cardunculus var. scolymus]|uniref:F-box domain, cyclin-like protein n=1 Tax=Cynara cardunculus var. scolymus TaxID=59895 RepID=A0A103Y0Y0_CYNCS|nr:hypothetical protein Ccrd_021244 [Cynara cardunculus var. scolymus]
MDLDQENVREDRLSSLPDELIRSDSKSAVQTCWLSSRWKLLWTSVPCLDFASDHSSSLPNVLSNRNHQIDMASLRAACPSFVPKIVEYAFAHNVQELNVLIDPNKHHEFPPCLFSSQSLKHFTLTTSFLALCLIPKTPWDFPALTTLHLQEVTFCSDNTDKSNVREDRLRSFPDELIRSDSKSAVQTCWLSSRWKLLWTSMPCLDFASDRFSSLPNVLSNRNHQIDVASLRAACPSFVRKIVDYAFAHNVQELNVLIDPNKHHELPPCLFSSQSLKHFTLTTFFLALCLVTKTPWDFPALTTLHLQEVTFCSDNTDKAAEDYARNEDVYTPRDSYYFS